MFLKSPIKILGMQVFSRDGQQPEACNFFFRPNCSIIKVT